MREFPHRHVVARVARANEPGAVLDQAAYKPLLQVGESSLQNLVAAIQFDRFSPVGDIVIDPERKNKVGVPAMPGSLELPGPECVRQPWMMPKIAANIR